MWAAADKLFLARPWRQKIVYWVKALRLRLSTVWWMYNTSIWNIILLNSSKLCMYVKYVRYILFCQFSFKIDVKNYVFMQKHRTIFLAQAKWNIFMNELTSFTECSNFLQILCQWVTVLFDKNKTHSSSCWTERNSLENNKSIEVSRKTEHYFCQSIEENHNNFLSWP